MTQAKIFDIILDNHPFVFRNNRGCCKTENRLIRYGIPEPKTKESDDDFKGGDYLGFTEIIVTPSMVGKSVAVFTNIEAKTKTDRLKSGQKRWHNFIIDHGGISKIFMETKDGIEVQDAKLD